MDKKDKKIQDLESLVVKLLAEITDLKRRLGLNSTNSSKPPSTDGLSKKPTPQSLKEKKPENFGGQKGHKGNTLKPFENPDNIIFHKIISCPDCTNAFTSNEPKEIIKRQVVDIEIKRIVTEHQIETAVCSCGCKVYAPFPQEVKAPVSYGSSVRSVASYLSNHFIPLDRLSQVFQDLAGIPVSDTTLMNFEEELSQKVTPFYESIGRKIEDCYIKHFDETGFRIAGKLNWLHVSSTGSETYYHVDSARGLHWENVKGILIHDFWKSYFKIPNRDHALCNAHHLRELKNLTDFAKEGWAERMAKLLRAACHYKDHPRAYAKFSPIYDKIIQEGLLFHEENLLSNHSNRKNRAKRKGHNLLIRLRDFKQAVLRFLTNPFVPFTNNQSEQDLRMMKLKQKISQGFRTPEGARRFAKIRSFISTMRKRKINMLEGLREAIAGNAMTFNLS